MCCSAGTPRECRASSGIRGNPGGPGDAQPGDVGTAFTVPAATDATIVGFACASADDVLARLSLPPFTVASPTGQSSRRTGLAKVVRWLEQQPGSTWQQRWDASSADAAGNVNWRWLCTGLTATSQTGVGSRSDFIAVGRAMLALIAADVIRPSLG